MCGLCVEGKKGTLNHFYLKVLKILSTGTDVHQGGGGFCGHLSFEILRNFAEILRNFAEFYGNFAVCHNFAVPFFWDLEKFADMAGAHPI